MGPKKEKRKKLFEDHMAAPATERLNAVTCIPEINGSFLSKNGASASFLRSGNHLFNFSTHLSVKGGILWAKNISEIPRGRATMPRMGLMSENNFIPEKVHAAPVAKRLSRCS